MPKRKTEKGLALPKGPYGAPLTLAIELPEDPRAAKDWTDDDETTSVGPVDDMQPIGRVTPVPTYTDILPQLNEADEEPTLLGPNPTIAEDDGEVGAPPNVEGNPWQVGIDWSTVKRVEFIDLTAIALYGRGFPVQNCYTKAKLLWEQRCKEGIR